MAKKTTKKITKKETPMKKEVDRKVDELDIEDEEFEFDDDLDEELEGEKKGRKKLLRGLIVLLVLVLALGFLFKDQFVVAVVNGQPIFRHQVIGELEKQGGKNVTDNLVTKMLILQEAKKKGVSVSSEEIDKEIEGITKDLKAQGQELEKILELQGLTKEDMVEQIRIQKLVEKMAGSGIKVTDEDIDAYIEENQDAFDETTDMEELRKTLGENLRQQKLNENTQVWLEKLREEASINQWREY